MQEKKGFIWHEGKWYARVSSIVGGDYSHIDPQVLKNKQDIGTLVHKAIDDSINGELPDMRIIPHLGYYNSYRQWKLRTSPEFIQTEKRYLDNELMISGAIDCLAMMPYEKVPTIIDWKTSVSEAESWRLQGHLYHYLVSQDGMPISNRVLFLKLDKSGSSPVVFEYPIENSIMLYCKSLAKKFWAKNKSIYQ